jgi:thioredoxin-related protein
MKNIIKLLLVSSVIVTGFGFKMETKPIEGEGKIQWLTINEAYVRWKKEPRKFVLDVYTDWCGWCKVMDKSTFSDKIVADYVNRSFYAVKFNAEQKEDVMLGDKLFKYVDNGQGGGYHQLAASLLNNQLSYPTIVFLDEKMGMIQPVPGYRNALDFHQLITYFNGNYNKIEQFEKYQTETYQQIYANSKPKVETPAAPAAH